jgi:hypothetical protein
MEVRYSRFVIQSILRSTRLLLGLPFHRKLGRLRLPMRIVLVCFSLGSAAL